MKFQFHFVCDSFGGHDHTLYITEIIQRSAMHARAERAPPKTSQVTPQDTCKAVTCALAASHTSPPEERGLQQKPPQPVHGPNIGSLGQCEPAAWRGHSLRPLADEHARPLLASHVVGGNELQGPDALHPSAAARR